MIEYLRYGWFKWLKKFDEFDVMSIGKESKTGFILEVNLKYPEKLHASHNDYYLALEKLALPSDMLSDYCKKMQANVGKKLVM